MNDKKTREPMVIALATGKGGMKAANATFPFQKRPFKKMEIPIHSESARDQNSTTAIAL